MQVQTEPQPSAVTTSELVIVADRLTTGYYREPVLQEISFAVPRGALVGVIGPNGAGKSTLFRAIVGLLKPWQGRVLVGGRPARPSPDIAYIPQIHTVDWAFPVTVWDVVMMGRYPRLGLLRRPGARDRELAERALEQVRMQDFREKPIGALSGGQRQRVFLARALAEEPSILLFDEPVSGVDAPTQHFIFELLEQLCAEGRTALVASHDLSCVAQRFSQVLLLNRRMFGFGPPERVFTEELLNQTFDTHLLLLRYGDRVIVVESPEDGTSAC